MTYAKLDSVKFGLAAGIVTALCVALTTICALMSWFPAYTALAMPWIESIYGFLGFKISWLGVVLGAVYSFIDVFIFGWIFALIYNKLL